MAGQKNEVRGNHLCSSFELNETDKTASVKATEKDVVVIKMRIRVSAV